MTTKSDDDFFFLLMIFIIFFVLLSCQTTTPGVKVVAREYGVVGEVTTCVVEEDFSFCEAILLSGKVVLVDGGAVEGDEVYCEVRESGSVVCKPGGP